MIMRLFWESCCCYWWCCCVAYPAAAAVAVYAGSKADVTAYGVNNDYANAEDQQNAFTTSHL
jgi:hypothetical protein